MPSTPLLTEPPRHRLARDDRRPAFRSSRHRMSTVCFAISLVALLGWVAWVSPLAQRFNVPRTVTLGAQGGARSAPTTERARPTALDPGLVDALERARSVSGRELPVTSGHRTVERQEELLDEAIIQHGSREAAERWVFPPDRSMHVEGLAIDIGRGPDADWLAANGGAFGICRTLQWEWWHFEWRQRWEAAGACPAAATDPADAPSR